MQVYQWALFSNAPFTFLQTFSAWRLIFFFKKYISFVLSQYKNKAHCTYCSIGKFFCLFKWLLLLLKRLWYCFLPCSLALYSVHIYRGLYTDCVRPIWAVIFLWSQRVLGFLPQNYRLYKLVKWIVLETAATIIGRETVILFFEMVQCWLDFQKLVTQDK